MSQMLQGKHSTNKMIPGSRETIDFQPKQERDRINHIIQSSRTTSRWAGFKNPRIVRVSRSFGGKDRHSKVCTIRGLRDRRIRLSVPTALELYDLQEKLGLNQPSKVVDWLLNATKHEIDKLPPLQMPPGTNPFAQFYQHHHQPNNNNNNNNASQSSFSAAYSLFNNNGANPLIESSSNYKEGIKISDNNIAVVHDAMVMMMSSQAKEDTKSKFPAKFAALGANNKDKGVERETFVGKNKKWMISSSPSTTASNDEQENRQGGGIMIGGQNFVHQNFIAPPPAFTNSIYNFYNTPTSWDPSNLTLSQFGNQWLPPPPQTEEGRHTITTTTTTTTTTSNSASPLFFCPSSTNPPPASLFPPYFAPPENFHFLNSNSSQHFLPNPLMPSLHHFPLKSFPLGIHHNPNKVMPSPKNQSIREEDKSNGAG